MTATETLSARIAALEAQAQDVPGLRELLADLDAQRHTTHALLASALHAEHLLTTIRGHAERLFAAGELLERDSQLDINSESIQAAFDPEARTAPIPDLPLISEPTDSTAETGSSASATTESNSASLPVNLPMEPELFTGVDTQRQTEDAHQEREAQSGEAPSASLPPTGIERLSAWLLTMEPETIVDARLAAAALDIPETSCNTYLQKLCRAGEIVREPGTGKPGVPSQYRRTGGAELITAASESAQEPAELPPFGPTSAQPRPATAASAPVAAKGQPAAPTATLPEIPTRLSTDEASVFDCLRKSGPLAPRVLQSRLNWGSARLDRAVQLLLKAGHLGRTGDKLIVIPAELASARAM